MSTEWSNFLAALQKPSTLTMDIPEINRHHSCKEGGEEQMRKAIERHGVVCNKCEGHNHHWNKLRKSREGKKCHHEATSGTVMIGRKLALMPWFTAIHLLTNTKISFFTLDIQRYPGVKRDQPAWKLVHRVMGLRDERHELDDEAEIDECFVIQFMPSHSMRV